VQQTLLHNTKGTLISAIEFVAGELNDEVSLQLSQITELELSFHAAVTLFVNGFE